MYYIVSEESGKILDCVATLTPELLLWAAIEFETDVYVIDGENSGLSASYRVALDVAQDDLVCATKE